MTNTLLLKLNKKFLNLSSGIFSVFIQVPCCDITSVLSVDSSVAVF